MAEIIIPGGSSDAIVSGTGEYVVPPASVVGQLVYISGGKIADLADNGSVATAPARGIIIAKPAAAVATLLFSGQFDGYVGLTPSEQLFLGSAGGFVTVAGLPTNPGEVVQKVGVVVSSTTILFFPHQLVIL